jgi:UDP-N-acetylmuramate: L-alanyl-gamma-D-glutamyl-meso-diaminopimelate ligase
MIAIGGTGMAPLACLLKELGHNIRGSDVQLYPPMSKLLSAADINPLVGYDPSHLVPRPDLAIVGNAVPRDNVEAIETERIQIDRISMPEAFARFFLKDTQPLVVAGTHGKTTTTALAAWVYSDCGQDPGFLIGGVPLNFSQSFHNGSGNRFIIEGDEYNAAYFDRGPKFLHYSPETLILTSVEHDHVDLYPDSESLLRAYRTLIATIPSKGLLVAYGDSPEVRQVTCEAPCRVLFYGLQPENDVYPAGPIETDSRGSTFWLEEGTHSTEVQLPMAGSHSVANALAVWTAARNDGLSRAAIARALRRFKGVKRRMEDLGTANGVTIVEDFAHHPTAVEKTLIAARERFPERRIVAVYEPRSLTAGRAFLFEAYLRAFSRADTVYLAPIFHAQRIAAAERLDRRQLKSDLEARGVECTNFEQDEPMVDRIGAEVTPGDVVVSMSSGSFDGFPNRLLQALAASCTTTVTANLSTESGE